MTQSTRRVSRLTAPIVVAALTLAACGDDDSTGAVATEPAAPVTEASATDTAVDETGGATIEVVAFDYGYEGIPDTVEAGTVFTLVNTAPAELHEFVAIRLPDDEDRPVSELVTLPIEELGGIVAVEPAAVLLALPDGGQMIPAVGDGTLSEPGRYAIICMIPAGADPEGYLEAAAASQGGPPEVEGGPPHIALGMFAEVTVT
ncbi:MAG: hypothetical protein EA389_08615 [Ilumatobacter sp.]|nr:MAG: hypothetical protein EA389_08615 [Ilumatobacter sp.]